MTRLRLLDSNANSWYHALQVNAQKRLSNRLAFTVAYTWSRAMGEGYGRNEGGGATQNTYQNPRDRAAEKTRYGFDYKHNTVISFLYELPTIPAFRDNIAKHIFGGWQTTGIVALRSGLPFTVSQGNTLNTAESPVRPDRLSDGKLATPHCQQMVRPRRFPNRHLPTAGQHRDRRG